MMKEEDGSSMDLSQFARSNFGWKNWGRGGEKVR